MSSFANTYAARSHVRLTAHLLNVSSNMIEAVVARNFGPITDADRSGALEGDARHTLSAKNALFELATHAVCPSH
jgi:hypothetical protein